MTSHATTSSILSRRQFVLSAGAASLLAACGDGSTFEPLVPTRIVSFGDGWSDLGQAGGANARYTVNDGSANIWVLQLAARYGLTLTASSAGGFGFAQFDARVSTASSANSIESQITAYLASNTPAAKEIHVIDPGVSELIALHAAHPTGAALNSAATAAGQALAAQAIRLANAGSQHVVVANAPDLGKTPFATTAGRVAELMAASRTFNDALKVALAGVTSGILLIDNEAYVNLVHNNPTSYLGAGAINNAPACPGAANSCTTANANASYNLYMYADDRHITPALHRLVGDNAYNRIKGRW